MIDMRVASGSVVVVPMAQKTSMKMRTFVSVSVKIWWRG